MRRAGSALLISLCVFTACLADAAEPYRYGNLVAHIGPQWLPTPLMSPGTTLVTFRRTTDEASSGPSLFWLETTPLTAVSPEAFVQSVVRFSGMQENSKRLERHRHGAYQIVLDSTIGNTAARASLYSYRSGQQLYLLGFVASPKIFDELRGDTLPFTVFLGGQPNDDVAIQKDPVPPDHVHASVDGETLTQKMMLDTLALAEFLAATAIKRSDKEKLRQEIIEDFASSTQEERDGYRQISTLMDQLASANTTKRAQIRRDMRARIWLDSRKLDEASPFIDLIERYNPVLGADERLGLVAPGSALDALLASNSFVATRAGMQPFTPTQRDQFAAEIERTYSALNDKQKRYLANGETNWLKLVAVWPTWDEAAQNKHLRIVGVGGIDAAEQVPQVARNLEHWAGIDASSQQVKKMLGMQGDMMVLQHLRGLLSTTGSN